MNHKYLNKFNRKFIFPQRIKGAKMFMISLVESLLVHVLNYRNRQKSVYIAKGKSSFVFFILFFLRLQEIKIHLNFLFFQELKSIENSSVFPFFIGGLAGKNLILTRIAVISRRTGWSDKNIEQHCSQKRIELFDFKTMLAIK